MSRKELRCLQDQVNKLYEEIKFLRKEINVLQKEIKTLQIIKQDSPKSQQAEIKKLRKALLKEIKAIVHYKQASKKYTALNEQDYEAKNMDTEIITKHTKKKKALLNFLTTICFMVGSFIGIVYIVIQPKEILFPQKQKIKRERGILDKKIDFLKFPNREIENIFKKIKIKKIRDLTKWSEKKLLQNGVHKRDIININSYLSKYGLKLCKP